jgi:hypothetical protein
MPDTSDLEGHLHDLMSTSQPATRAWSAMITTVNGLLAVPGRSGYIYVQMPDSGILQVFNARVTPKSGQMVMVGYDPLNPSVLQVLSWLNTWQDDQRIDQAIVAHAPTHEYLNPTGGSDPVWVRDKMYLPLNVQPAGGMLIQVYPAVVNGSAGYVAAGGSTMDLTSHIPVGGHRWVLVYLDATGAVQLRDGAIVPSFGFGYLNIPATSTPERPLAAVHMYPGQTSVVETSSQEDILDLRVSGNSGSSESDEALALAILGL